MSKSASHGRIIFPILIIIVIQLISGCGTMISQNIYGKKIYDNEKEYREETCGISQPNVYSGTAFDSRVLLGPFVCNLSGEKGMVMISMYPIIGPFALIDLPLSIVMDTLILPYTAYKQSKYGNMIELKEK